jgi:hypothetical protein
VDAAGNEAQARTVEIKKDTVAPDISIKPSNWTVTEGDRLIIDLSGSTDESRLLSYHVSFGEGENLSFRSSPAFDHIYYTAGKYIVVATVRDAAGNEAQTTVGITVVEQDVVPPAKDDGSGAVVFIAVGGLALVLLVIVAALAAVLLSRRRSFEVSDPEPVRTPPAAQAMPAAPAPQNLSPASAHTLPPPPVPPTTEE